MRVGCERSLAGDDVEFQPQRRGKFVHRIELGWPLRRIRVAGEDYPDVIGAHPRQSRQLLDSEPLALSATLELLADLPGPATPETIGIPAQVLESQVDAVESSAGPRRTHRIVSGPTPQRLAVTGAHWVENRSCLPHTATRLRGQGLPSATRSQAGAGSPGRPSIAPP